MYYLIETETKYKYSTSKPEYNDDEDSDDYIYEYESLNEFKNNINEYIDEHLEDIKYYINALNDHKDLIVKYNINPCDTNNFCIFKPLHLSKLIPEKVYLRVSENNQMTYVKFINSNSNGWADYYKFEEINTLAIFEIPVYSDFDFYIDLEHYEKSKLNEICELSIEFLTDFSKYNTLINILNSLPTI